MAVACGSLGGNLLEAADRLEWPLRDLPRLIEIGRNAYPAVSATLFLKRRDPRSVDKLAAVVIGCLTVFEKHNVRRPHQPHGTNGCLSHVNFATQNQAHQQIIGDWTASAAASRAGPPLPALHPG